MGALAAIYEEFIRLAALPIHAARVAEMKRTFEQRTGPFGPNDPWFEERTRTFWDDAFTRQGFCEHVADELSEPMRAHVVCFRRATRGLFRTREAKPHLILEDAFGGAEFVVTEVDPGLREAIATSEGLIDARLVASDCPFEIQVLPGALFHPETATDQIDRLLIEARKRNVSIDDTLDAFLRMELALRSLARVKPAYAYRLETLLGRGDLSREH